MLQSHNRFPHRLLGLLCLVVLLFSPLATIAADRTIELKGYVRDDFTHLGIMNVMVTLLNEQGVPVDSQRVQCDNEGKTYMSSFYSFQVPAVPATYTIRAEHPDYDVLEQQFAIRHVARNTSFDVPMMNLKPRTLTKQGGELGEVVVKATKVKIVFRGDTVTYRADAFNLPQGYMLDELIR